LLLWEDCELLLFDELLMLLSFELEDDELEAFGGELLEDELVWPNARPTEPMASAATRAEVRLIIWSSLMANPCEEPR
jgi:hypothetical protein